MKNGLKFLRIVLLTFFVGSAANAADHIDAPLATAHPGTDITDVYAFVNGDRLVMAMTVHPFAAADAELFDPNARYYFFVDTDGDAKSELFLRVDFSSSGSFKLTGSLKSKVQEVFTGRREDPFFFDLGLLGEGLNGSDTFAGADVGAIVVEFDLEDVTPDGPAIGVWGVTRKQGIGAVDRMGRPVINTLFLPEGRKDEFNRARPVSDGAYAEFVPLPEVLLPDILTIDTSQPTAYPNGRALSDDVIDLSLGLVFGEGTDEVDANDVEFLNAFPYLAPPNSSGAAAKGALALEDGPRASTLIGARPNPFNPSTEISFELAADGAVSLKVFNLAGQEVRTLKTGFLKAGYHGVVWDAKNDLGHGVASGIYLYTLEIHSAGARQVLSRQMTLLR